MTIPTLFERLYAQEKTTPKRQKIVKPEFNGKTHFTNEDVRYVERFLQKRIQVRGNRLTDKQGIPLNATLKEDFALVQKSREQIQTKEKRK